MAAQLGSWGKTGSTSVRQAITAPGYRITCAKTRDVIEKQWLSDQVGGMKTILFTLAFIVAAQTAQAACYADYKAKKDNPLRLHYGVAQVDNCSAQSARAALKGRLEREGWTLLNVLGVFDDAGLSERKELAGKYYLRF